MNNEIFVRNVEIRCKQKGVPPTVACRDSCAGKDFLTNMKKGQSPSLGKAQQLAQYLGCTVSDLLGEAPVIEVPQFNSSMDTITRIFELADRVFPEQQAFAAAIGVSPKTVSVWRTGRGKSYTKYLRQIAEALNTSVEYLLTGKQTTVPDSGTLSAAELRHLAAYRAAPAPIRAIVDTALEPYTLLDD